MATRTSRRASSPSDKVAALSRAIHEALLAGQKTAKAPKGFLKCPRCGAAVEPTKNGRIRTHDADPYDRLRCSASGAPWKEFGKGTAAAPAAASKKRPVKGAKRR